MEVQRSGFEAATFTSGTELVISFAGTYPGTLLGPKNALGRAVDFATDVALAVGGGDDQLLQAVQYYLERKRENPSATTITLTGHSLGGGLAALVGVFFGIQANTFDQAPFAKSAQALWNPLNIPPDVATKLRDDLRSSGYTESELAPLSNFLALRQEFGGIPNAQLINSTRVDGEFLSDWPVFSWQNIIGNPPSTIQHAPTTANGIDLHAQSLLIAFLQTEQSVGAEKSLSKLSYKLTDLLAMLVNANLYARSTDTFDENFLERLVRHEFGNAPNVVNGVTVGVLTADAMVTRFTRDLWNLAQDGGLTMNDGIPIPGYFQAHNISKALTAFAMQMYYEDTANAINASKQLFTDLSTAGTGSNGITFDMRDVSKELAAAMDSTDPNTKVDLTKAKGYQYFKTYIQTAFAPAERTLINSLLPILRDWTIQAGASALTATDTQNRNAFLLGGKDSDGLVGGTGADLLIGNGGADLLQGKGGNDILLGGSGDDTYVYSTGDGLDTILDTAGQNTLAVDGDILSGGAEYGDSRVHRSADGKHLYVETGGRMLIDGNLVIENYATGGSFGLALTGPSADPDLPTLTGNASDNFIGAAVYNRSPDYSQTAKATLPGTTIEVGELTGAATATLLEGKGGSDILRGGGGNDRLYADSRIGAATAIANGNIVGSGSSLKGDWLAGGIGDDTLVGGAGKDVLSGGAGKDLLIAGAGDDDILGDTDYLATSFEWTVTDSNGVRLFNPVAGAQAPAGGAADVIYAGEGKDYVWAGIGNDVVFGEGGDDSLNGNEGNDILLGGAGADTLWGGIDNDYLDGGAGVDQIQGGEGDDILIGGTEVDTLFGDAGRDTYIFNRGDGRDTVIDTRADNNIFQFGVGISASDINLHLGSLLIDLGSGDEIHIADFDQNDVFNSSSIGMFQFADGTSLTIDELLAKGFDLDGTDGDDSIIGTNTVNRIDGKAGNDLIWGLDGNDTITGGLGTDAMNGGLGDDTYVFSAGDSATEDGTETGAAEELLDTGGTDTIRFAAGIDTQNLVLTDNLDGELVIDYSAPGQALDRLLIYHGLSGAVEKYEVGAGDTARTLSHTQFIGEFGNGIYSGTDAANHLHLTGGKTADSLFAATGQATVSGGRGDDTLTVFGTNNAILYSVGDGTDRVTTSAAGGIGNVLRLSGPASAGSGQALTADDLSLRLGANRELVVQVGGDAADAILFATFNPDDAAAKAPFDHIEFDPSTGSGQTATTLSYADLLAKGFDIAGTAGNDLLTGTSVTDRISGGAGNDILLGGAGDDVYRFNPGDGLDVIQDIQGLNSVEFGAGLTAAAMTATQSLADDGQRYLDLDFGNGDRLSILDGELGRVGSFAFAPSAGSGQAGTVLNMNQVLALLPMVNLRGGDGDEVFAGFGGNDLIDGGAGNDELTGGEGADRLYGGLGNDTLEGDAGDDRLDGGAGNDTLIGGSGIDSYRFGLGMGQDTVIDTVGEAAVLELMAGTNTFTLAARQEGDDLLLAARSGSDAIRLTGYYADPEAGTHWTVKTADGLTRDMNTFLQGIGGQVSTGAEFIAQFRQRWVGEWNAWHASNGYSIGDDGVARRAQSSMTTTGTATVLRSETESVALDVGDFYTGDGADTYEVRYGFLDTYTGLRTFSWPAVQSNTNQSSSTTTSTVIREADLSSRTALEPWDQPQPIVPTEPFFIPLSQLSSGDCGSSDSLRRET